jgi:hypothetical protein
MIFGKKEEKVVDHPVDLVIGNIKTIDSKQLITLMKYIIAELDFRDEDDNDDIIF